VVNHFALWCPPRGGFRHEMLAAESKRVRLNKLLNPLQYKSFGQNDNQADSVKTLADTR